MSGILQERHELNRDGLMQVLENCEKMNQFSGYFRETAQMMQYLNEIYDVPEKSLQQLAGSVRFKLWKSILLCGEIRTGIWTDFKLSLCGNEKRIH